MEKGEKKERRFSEEQYDRLRRCSEKKDMTEWNRWRKEGAPDNDIFLEGARLPRAYLKGVFLNTGLNSGFGGEAHLEGAEFHGANLEDAFLMEADLKDAKLVGSHLEGADFSYANLENADFRRAVVDGGTLLWRCEVDRKTDFRGVGVDSCRIDQRTKQLLEYNGRRMNWEDWYKGHWFWRWPVRFFWVLSDYGRSTGWVIAWFFILALIFALIYFVWGLAEPPGIVSNLFELEGTTEGVYKYAIVDMTTIERQPGEPIKVGKGTALVRAIYFSVVTMTTLGFGDLYANPLRIAGHILLALQVILGYVLLGALITRFAVLFTAGGPAGRFSKRRIPNSEQGIGK